MREGRMLAQAEWGPPVSVLSGFTPSLWGWNKGEV